MASNRSPCADTNDEEFSSFLNFLETPSAVVPAPAKSRSLKEVVVHMKGSSITAQGLPKKTPFANKQDEYVRNLDVPVARFVRQAEEDALRCGNENGGFLSFRNGFLPMFYPEQALPEKFKVWDDLGKHLTQMMSDLTLRPYIENEMPVLAATEELDDRYLFRAALILGLSAHAYWYCGPKAPESLPSSLKVPWDEVNCRLGRRGSYLSGEDVQLYNFTYGAGGSLSSGVTFDCQAESFRIENLNMLQAMWANKAEIVFHLAFCEMAKAAAPIIGHIALAQEAMQQRDENLLLHTLHAIANCVEDIQVAFMKIIPDPRAKLGIEPLVWAKTVAPVGVSFNKGMPSPSGLGTPFFHCLDVFFSRGQYSSVLGKDSLEARAFFPKNWLGVLDAIASSSTHVYIAGSDNEELHAAWTNAIDSYASWNGLLGKHLQKTYNFLELAFKSGRETTLGGFSGGFSDRMWDKIMDMLDKSREERLTAKNATLKLPEAALRSAEGEGRIRTLTYELPHDGFDWRPGDTVLVWPSNSKERVVSVLEAMNATGHELVDLNEEWRLHLKKLIPSVGMRRGNRRQSARLVDIVRHAKLNPVPKKSFHCITSFFPDMACVNKQPADIIELFGCTRLHHGNRVLQVERGGILPFLKLPGPSKLYRSLMDAMQGRRPLAENIIAMLQNTGVENMPEFNVRVINEQEFEDKIYPLFVNLTGNGQKSASIVDLFCPIEPRQYSIANMKDHGDPCLKLIVSRLSYEMELNTRVAFSTPHGDSRSAMLAQKYLQLWKRKALKSTKKQLLSRRLTVDSFLDELEHANANGKKTKTVDGVASNYLNNEGPLLYSIERNVSFHPPNTSEPLVMIASGSGVSPFLGYLQERISKGSNADTLLLWSIPYLKEGSHILAEIEKMMPSYECGNIDVIVSVSRENEWPVFKAGKFRMVSKPRCQITEFIERNRAIRKRLNRLLIPKKYGGLGGYAYLCGSASFVRSALDVASDVLMDNALFKEVSHHKSFMADEHGESCSKWLMKKLQSDGKIVYEVFGDKTSRECPSFCISELVTKNDPTNGDLWICIYGDVYDVSDFVHPGGAPILHAYCGMNASTAWEAVRHHRSQSLNAKLTTLKIGKLKTPEFPTLPRLILGDGETTDLNGVFHVWSKLLQDIVEIENATRMEYTLDELHVAGDISSEALSPMKLQMIFQAHRRVVFVHIRNIKLGVNSALIYKEAVANPQILKDFSVPRETFLLTGNEMQKKIIEKIGKAKTTFMMLAACDGFISACHKIKDKNANRAALLGYLSSSAFAMERYDLNLLSKWKNSMRKVIIYLEECNSQTVSLPRLYHCLQSATVSMALDLEDYISKVSQPSVIGQLGEFLDTKKETCGTNESSWLNATPKTTTKPGWQT